MIFGGAAEISGPHTWKTWLQIDHLSTRDKAFGSSSFWAFMFNRFFVCR